jgi:hypothetical protein
MKLLKTREKEKMEQQMFENNSEKQVGKKLM